MLFNIKNRLFFVILMLMCTSLKADYVWTQNCLKGYEAVIALNFEAADNYLLKEKRDHPENLLSIYIESQMGNAVGYSQRNFGIVNSILSFYTHHQQLLQF